MVTAAWFVFVSMVLSLLVYVARSSDMVEKTGDRSFVLIGIGLWALFSAPAFILAILVLKGTP